MAERVRKHRFRLPPRCRLRDKQALVDDVFHSVAGRYDLMNDLMSGGLHRAWKDALVTAVNPPPKPRGAASAFALLDLAGGTGDVAFRVADAGGTRHPRHRRRHQRRDARGRPRARRASAVSTTSYVHRGQCRGAAVSRPHLRRGHHRVRHPQRAAHRLRARRGLSRAADRRALPVPGILRRRRAGARPALRRSIRSTSSRRSAAR